MSFNKYHRLILLLILAAILLLSSCTTTKHTTREKTDTTIEQTTVIDTSVVVRLKPIEFSGNIEALPTLGSLPTAKLDTIKNDNGDLLIIDRKGEKINFKVEPQPQKIDVKAKKTIKTHSKTFKSDKIVEKPLYLYYVFGIVLLVVVIGLVVRFRKLF